MQGAATEAPEDRSADADSPARMPTRVEDVDKFMEQLAAAASGGRLPDDQELEGAPTSRI